MALASSIDSHLFHFPLMVLPKCGEKKSQNWAQTRLSPLVSSVLEHVGLFSKSFLKPLIGASKIIYNLGDESDPEVDPIRITTTIKQCYIYYNTPDIQVLAIMMCERTI